MILLLHAGEAVMPHDLWREWSAPPVEAVSILFTAIWYASGVRNLWLNAGTGRGITQGRAASFGGGIVALIIALMSPLDAAADELFSAHMAQHLVLILVAAPLLVSGAPLLAFTWALPRWAAHRIAPWWNRRHALRALLRVTTLPGVVFTLHMMALWFWHLPGPYQLALASAPFHALEHLSFLCTAALLWWVIAPSHGPARANDGEAIALVVGTLMQGGVLGALITLANHPWYPAHATGATLNGLSALEDQQLAGLIMWIPSAAVYVVTAAWLFLRWFRRDERGFLQPGSTYVAPLSNGAVR